jgi:hypothetical protein
MQWGEARKCNIYAKTRISFNKLSKLYNYLQKYASSLRVQLLLTPFITAADFFRCHPERRDEAHVDPIG